MSASKDILLIQEPVITFSHNYDEAPFSPNDARFNIHAHKVHEIFYFISGTAEYLVEGTVYSLKPGSILIMRSGELHKIQLKGEEPYERYVLNFSDDLVRKLDSSGELLKPFYNRPLGVGNYFSPNGARLGRIFETMRAIDAIPNGSKTRKLALTTNLFSILFELYMADQEREERGERLGTANAMCAEILSYINEHLTESLSLTELCERFFISKNHLNRIFKASTGVTVWEYVKVKRLSLARDALYKGSTASEACLLSGFRDYSAFYRAYKERYGLSPKEMGRH